mmetsp:Transcript_5383/g.7275  ORF Transcript_5383/g.7275 Transcript_5383/m.7275 type:complete len:243 (+) Transcript_5383:157-885(+)|eukprot:CAMPEP_0196585892 /NCGR_PEP_ID=MMETSP1081-20130531/52447_1 /TAXON_ID=36882 /ORGANISM="Pyramimonas amylifera, Strain CCMP720" /LENGTH=242 /DNA_ID=CAMNT_0041907591 /DNA_START=150 /DNA_END=878 /DNA_ORIENTATION=-
MEIFTNQDENCFLGSNSNFKSVQMRMGEAKREFGTPKHVNSLMPSTVGRKALSNITNKATSNGFIKENISLQKAAPRKVLGDITNGSEPTKIKEKTPKIRNAQEELINKYAEEGIEHFAGKTFFEQELEKQNLDTKILEEKILQLTKIKTSLPPPMFYIQKIRMQPAEEIENEMNRWYSYQALPLTCPTSPLRSSTLLPMDLEDTLEFEESSIPSLDFGLLEIYDTEKRVPDCRSLTNSFHV